MPLPAAVAVVEYLARRHASRGDDEIGRRTANRGLDSIGLASAHPRSLVGAARRVLGERSLANEHRLWRSSSATAWLRESRDEFGEIVVSASDNLMCDPDRLSSRSWIALGHVLGLVGHPGLPAPPDDEEHRYRVYRLDRRGTAVGSRHCRCRSSGCTRPGAAGRKVIAGRDRHRGTLVGVDDMAVGGDLVGDVCAEILEQGVRDPAEVPNPSGAAPVKVGRLDHSPTGNEAQDVRDWQQLVIGLKRPAVFAGWTLPSAPWPGTRCAAAGWRRSRH